MASRVTAGASLLLGAALVAGCGSGAAKDDPVGVTEAYMSAVQAGADSGKQYLETETTEKLSGSTTASRYLAAHKGAKWKVVTVNYPDPGSIVPVATKKECLIGQPAPGQICVVTVEVDAGAKPVWFHFVLENRYSGKWQIIDVDEVDKAPDELLPVGPQAHNA